MPTWANNPGTALPHLSYCFCSLPDLSKSALWYHFQFFPPVLFLPGFREHQRLQQIQSGLKSPPHPLIATSLVTFPIVDSGPPRELFS